MKILSILHQNYSIIEENIIMEVIYIETKLFEKMMNQFNAFTKQVDSLCQKVDVKNLGA
ncbi:hypothetical protein [Bacteroides caecimuris]|uniref:hypothetical protein n=1 Tax=Bacteroides caecimuris TaxID=1796613 RepID=UPI00265CCC29|nr:hypothetical protein [Bacteroides caecimuris]